MELTILDLLHQVTLDQGDSLAIVHEDRELSFYALEALANQFANALQDAGVCEGQTVGLSIDRCPEAIAAMLGVLKVGAIFVPLDPEYPLDRVQFMMRDAEITVVITHQREFNSLARELENAGDQNTIWIDSAAIEFAQLEETYQANQLRPDQAAYIMYTSGSTGTPKGVVIEHRALLTYCLADIEVYELTAQDRTLQFSTLNFDIAIEEIFPPLLIGGCVVIRPRERSVSANELSEIVERYAITALHLATAYWHEWVNLLVSFDQKVPSTVRLAIATGEKVSVEHYRRWLNCCEHEVLWCNAYGPTEATVTATVYKPTSDFNASQMPIGAPLPGYSAFVLDDRMQPVNDGETGELFIGGPALAREYLNRPELTDTAFVKVDLGDIGTHRLYRTGDLARWSQDGNIEFAGRRDHQIKLGSYRIEPGEIEAAINKHPMVEDSLVLYEMVDEQKFLIAYVATGDSAVEVAGLVEFLSSRLPNYMVPPRYVFLNRFPTTINGKIDRDALPDPSLSITATSRTYVAPRTDLETRLAELWSQTLNLPRIGIHDDFFGLGGSSLLVARVVTELSNEFDIAFPVRDFFANPTIASSARHLARLLGAEETDNEQQDAQRALESQIENQLLRQRLPEIHPSFLVSGDRRLFCVHYQPRGKSSSLESTQRHAVLICHALGHEYTRAYRNLQQLALNLCHLGFDVLRFDYSGTGNSSGDCDSFRLESLQADTRRAAEFLLQNSGADDYSVIGIRAGATIVATTRFSNQPEHMILWDPILDGNRFLQVVDKLHHYALNSQTRFTKVIRDPAPGQAFGHAMTEEKRSSLNSMRLPVSCSTSNLLLTSCGYAESQPGFEQLQTSWNHALTTDEIYWDRPEFTESAFASPDAFRQITQFLCTGGWS